MAYKYGFTLSEALYMENLNGRTLKEVVRYIFGESVSEDRIHEIGQEKESIYRDLYRSHLTPTAGLIHFLDQCQAAGIPMVVGTSAPTENVEFTLDGLGIRDRFRGVLDHTAVTKGKPDPEIYQKCAASVGLDNAQCVVFEDAISGIKAGKAAGSKVIGLATSHRREELEADLIIDDFTQIDVDKVRHLLSSQRL